MFLLFKKIRLNLFGQFALFIFALSACSKDLPLEAHNIGANTSLQAVSPEEASLSKPAVTALDENDIAALEAARKSFFNEKNLLSPLNNNSDKRRALSQYNEVLIRISNADPKSAAKYLSEYESLVSLGCTGQQLTGCRLIPFFQSSANSYSVWKYILSQTTSDSLLSRKRAWIGWRLANAQDQSGLNSSLLFLKESERLAEIASKTKDKSLENEIWNSVYRIISAPGDLQKSNEYEEFVKKMLDTEITFRSSSPKERIIETLVAEESARGLFNKDWFAKTLNKFYGKSADGYLKSLDELNKIAPATLLNFSIAEKMEQGPVFYLIDNVYLDIWSSSASYQLWQKSNPSKSDLKKLHSLISQYSKVQILAEVAQSNKIMSDFFKNRKNFNSSDIHIEAYRTSQTIQGNWVKQYAALARLRSFAMMVFGTGTPEMLSLKLDQENLNEASLYLVSFPHMLVLAYEMAIHKFKISNWFASVDHTSVIQWLFSGQFGESFFDYTQGNTSLGSFNPTQILYSIHFALKMQTFESFDIKPQDFVSLVVNELIKGATKSTNRYSQNAFFTYSQYWSSPFDTMRTEFEELANFCNSENKFTGVGNSDSKRSYHFNIDLDELDRHTIMGSDIGRAYWDNTLHARIRDKKKNEFTRTGLILFSQEHEQVAELLRTQITSVVHLLNDLVAVFQLHIKETKQEDSVELKTALADIQTKLDSIKHESRRFYSYVFHYINDFMIPCNYLLIRKEFDTQNAIIKYELEWLKQVYRDYQKLKLNPNGNAITAKYKISEPGLDKFSGYDSFDFQNEMYVGHKIDALFRFKKYLSEGLKTDTVNLPPINPALNVVVPEGFKELTIVNKPVPFQLSFKDIDTEDEFAKKYIRLMRSPEGSYSLERSFAVYHYNSYSLFSSLLNEPISLLVAIYKAGEVEAYPWKRQDCLSEKPLADCRAEKMRVDVETLRTTLFSALDVVTGSKEDKEIFSLLGIKARAYHSKIPTQEGLVYIYSPGHGLLYMPQTLRPMAFFDSLYLLSTNTALGYYKRVPWEIPPERGYVNELMQLQSFERAVQLYKVRQGEQYLIFSPSDLVRDLIFTTTKARVDLEFNGIAAIEKLAERTRQEDMAAGFTREYYLEILGKPVRNFYIDPIITGNHSATVWDFHKSTGYIYSNSSK